MIRNGLSRKRSHDPLKRKKEIGDDRLKERLKSALRTGSLSQRHELLSRTGNRPGAEVIHWGGPRP